MKKTAVLLYFLVFFSLYAQQVQDNPEKPQNENPGRIIKLTEVMHIKSEGEDYFYSSANKLLIDLSGNIYLRDFWSSRQRAHLPVFSPDGRFLKDLYKQGEGPGEIASGYDFSLSESRVFVYDYSKRKIIVMEHDGTFLEEFKPASGSSMTLVGTFENWLVFTREDMPSERKTSRLYDKKNVIVFVSMDGKIEKDSFTLMNKEFLISPAQGGGMMFWDPFISVIGDGKLFVSSSQEYLVEVLDLKTGKITARMKRKYSRVRHVMQDWEPRFISQFNAPKRRFEPDIEALFYAQGQLWVHTSREEDDKGQLFDVFDSEGHFLDSFYIPLKGRIVRIEDDFIFSVERDEDLLPYVVKYSID